MSRNVLIACLVAMGGLVGVPRLGEGAIVRRLEAASAYQRCALGGEERLALDCAPPIVVGRRKGIRAVGGRRPSLRLHGTVDGPLALQVEAFAYDRPPRDRLDRLMLAGAAWQPGATMPGGLAQMLGGIPAFGRLAMPVVREASLPNRLALDLVPPGARRVAVVAWAIPMRVARYELPLGDVPPAAAVALAFGVRDAGNEWSGARCRFTAAVRTGDGRVVALGEWRIDPATRADDRGWQDRQVELPEGAAHGATLLLSAQPEDGEEGLGVWAQPQVLAAATAPAPPNLVLLSIDTLRADHLGIYGYTRPTSPRLDAFIAGGTRFANAYSQFPSTTASHMTMLTGRDPCAHGVLLPTDVLPPSIPTVAEVLSAAGYATAAVTEDALIHGAAGFDRGFDSYRDMLISRKPLGLFPTGIGHARRWLSAHESGPFFLFLHTYQVHVPYKFPDAMRSLFAVPADAVEAVRQAAAYDRGLRYADDMAADFLEAIAHSEIGSRTLIVLTSDHGTEFGEHGGIGHARGVHVEQLHVPLVLRDPTHVPAGRVVDTIVEVADVAPALLDAAGVAVPAGMAEPRLLSAARGESVPSGSAFGEQLWGPRQTALRTTEWTWIQNADGVQLYDRQLDPTEQRNLAPTAPARAQEGAARIAAYRTACTKEHDAARTSDATTPIDAARRRSLEALGYVLPEAPAPAGP